MPKLPTYTTDLRTLPEEVWPFYERNPLDNRYELQLERPAPTLKPRKKMTDREKAHAIGALGLEAYLNLPE